VNVALALQHLGFRVDVDFIASHESLTWLSAQPQPTMQEIESAWPAAQAALAAAAQAKKTADDQQTAGIVEAKRAYARMQQIIDGADTATTAQLRAAIKEMAGTIQHLIRAAVR
jgi:hypothetical protein